MHAGQDLLTPRLEPRVDPVDAAALLAGLPTWFGIPAATAGYVDAANRLPGFTAYDDDGVPLGIALWEHHFAPTVELHLIAVSAEWHRRGVGRSLLDAVERAALDVGAHLLEVKTLGPSHPDPGYAATRRFYEAVGFLPLEELTDLWDEGNPCLVMVKPLVG